MYDEKGRLTREGAINQIKAGGSVLINGKLYNKVENLPGEADFAKGDTTAEDSARESLLKQKADIEAQLKSLPPKAPVDPKAAAKAKADADAKAKAEAEAAYAEEEAARKSAEAAAKK